MLAPYRSWSVFDSPARHIEFFSSRRSGGREKMQSIILPLGHAQAIHGLMQLGSTWIFCLLVQVPLELLLKLWNDVMKPMRIEDANSTSSWQICCTNTVKLGQILTKDSACMRHLSVDISLEACITSVYLWRLFCDKSFFDGLFGAQIRNLALPGRPLCHVGLALTLEHPPGVFMVFSLSIWRMAHRWYVLLIQLEKLKAEVVCLMKILVRVRSLLITKRPGWFNGSRVTWGFSVHQIKSPAGGYGTLCQL